VESRSRIDHPAQRLELVFPAEYEVELVYRWLLIHPGPVFDDIDFAEAAADDLGIGAGMVAEKRATRRSGLALSMIASTSSRKPVEHLVGLVQNQPFDGRQSREPRSR
jgi:hypothetical protein